MPARVVPTVHELPPLVQKILADLYGHFAFVNAEYYPLIATSVVKHDTYNDHVTGAAVSETTSKWYWDSDKKPLRTVLTFACSDTVLYADVFVHALETGTCDALVATGKQFLGCSLKEIQQLGRELIRLANDIAKPQIKIKVRCMSDIEYNCNEEKVIAHITTEEEWLDLVETTVKPMVRYAVQRDKDMDIYDGPAIAFMDHEHDEEPVAMEP